MERIQTKVGDYKKLKGRIIAPGIAFGYAHLEEPLPSAYATTIQPSRVQGEITRLEDAVARVRQRLEEYIRDFSSPAEEDLHQILSAQLIMLADQLFFDGIVARIRDRHQSAERAVEEEFNAVAGRLGTSRDLYLRARTEDLRGICQLIRKSLLLGKAAFGPIDREKKAPIYFSMNLRLTAVLKARRSGAVAFLTSSQAFTSHAAILIRTSRIPALGGLDLTKANLIEGTPILVDAIRGELHMNPTPEVMKSARRLEKRMKETVAHRAMPPTGARTKDGRKIALYANIDHPSQAVLCFQNRLSGIGLFRTEFMVMDTGHFPDEEEQYGVYRDLVKRLQGRHLVIRTFDFGADKVMTDLQDEPEDNPALGIRGLRRHLLRSPQELRTQFRALLRAAEGAELGILLPMVTHAGDVQKAKAILDAAKIELGKEELPYNPDVKIGVMIEVPSAALNIVSLLEAADFVSIGTNDLLQYLTASDRDNSAVVSYQDMDSSGLGSLLKFLMDGARSIGRESDVYVCGEIASDPEGARFLVQAGISNLSLSPGSAKAVRKALESKAIPGKEQPVS